MAVVRSGAFMDVQDVTFTYGVTPTIVTIKEVEDVQLDRKGSPVFHSGDSAPGPTIKKVTDQRREAKVMGADLETIQSIPAGVLGTLVWTELDMKNGVLAGARTLTLINCSLDDDSHGGKHNDVKKITASFSAVWTLTAGVYVDPLTRAVVASS